MEETREEEDEDKQSGRSAEAVSPSDHYPEEEDENERGVCVIVGQILVVKEMVLTVDY